MICLLPESMIGQPQIFICQCIYIRWFFLPVLFCECCSIPFTMASARLPWWFIFSSFSFISFAIALLLFSFINSCFISSISSHLLQKNYWRSLTGFVFHAQCLQWVPQDGHFFRFELIAPGLTLILYRLFLFFFLLFAFACCSNKEMQQLK